jgi:hypothetical protein
MFNVLAMIDSVRMRLAAHQLLIMDQVRRYHRLTVGRLLLKKMVCEKTIWRRHYHSLPQRDDEDGNQTLTMNLTYTPTSKSTVLNEAIERHACISFGLCLVQRTGFVHPLSVDLRPSNGSSGAFRDSGPSCYNQI